MSEWYVDRHDPKTAHLASGPNSVALCGAKVRQAWAGDLDDHDRHIICAMHYRGEIRLVTRSRMGTIERHDGADTQ
jgi:hypothetical protein